MRGDRPLYGRASLSMELLGLKRPGKGKKMATITVARLHKMLGELVESGQGRRPVCVNKATFWHPLESDGAVILEATEAKAETITMCDDDGGTATNKDGTEKTRKVFVIGGGHVQD